MTAVDMQHGQNVALPATTVRFTADSAVPFDLSALVTDSTLTARSSDDFVFYNQPHTRGVQIRDGGVDIDLDTVPPDAHAVLCIVSIDPLAGPGTTFTQVTAALHDHAGTPIAVLDIHCMAAETAVICWELYRRAGHWKVRAVGQGYSDGLAGLIRHHGVDVDATTESPTPHPSPDTDYAPIEPLDPNHVLERFGMIWEDAARSAGALIAAREFAESRLDAELSSAVADPATRNTPTATHARARAQHRHDDVVNQAQTRYQQDSTYLEKEIAAITPTLPRSFADWHAPAWTTNTPEPTGSSGWRIGELSAPHCGPLRIPLCLPFPLQEPLRIVGADTPATSAVTTAAVIRMLSADKNLHLDIIDLNAGLHSLTAQLTHRRNVTTITNSDGIGPHIESIIASAELARLAPDVDATASSNRLIVLNHYPYGYDQRHIPALRVLSEYGHRLRLFLVIVSDDQAAVEEIHPDLTRHSHALPADESRWRDPWTSNQWMFTPDSVPTDSAHLAHLLGVAAG
ncbi:TerD family protein [Rhodococcus triatomae]